MFVRIDRDLSVNINNIFSYQLSEDPESYKLYIWSIQGNLVHKIIYLKSKPEQLKLLIEFNEAMRNITVNPEIIQEEIIPDERFLEERISLDEEEN